MKSLLILLLLTSNIFCLNLQKPKHYQDNIDIRGWYMSEKFDGIRGYWDGEKLYTRKGIELSVPKWFIKNFPPFELDGELWTKRADFENIQNIVMDKSENENWKELTYNIFEVPNQKGKFLTRLNVAKKWFKEHPNNQVKFIAQIKCKNIEELNTFFENIIKHDGEGVIIKNGEKEYFSGRSSNILKLKKAYDMEGKIVDINYKNNHSMKSLVLELNNQIIFNLGGGFSDKLRLNPPKIGEIVKFKYYGFTKNGIPKFASFITVRRD